MPNQKFTVTGATERGHPLYIHVEAVDIASVHTQMKQAFTLGADYVIFAGHLDALEGGVALQILANGQLLDPPARALR